MSERQEAIVSDQNRRGDPQPVLPALWTLIPDNCRNETADPPPRDANVPLAVVIMIRYSYFILSLVNLK